MVTLNGNRFIKRSDAFNDMNLVKGDINHHIRRIAIPASIGFFFNTMYNVVDTFYAGQISTDALSALSISFPLFFMLIAIGTGISQGSNALISNALGEDNLKKAKGYIHQGLSYALIAGFSIMILGLLISPAAFSFLGAEGEYLELALLYMNTILLGAPFFLILQTGNSALLAQGDTKTFRNMLIGGFFLNIILNPIFLFGWGPIPEMGLMGIALSTVVIQLIGCFYVYSKVRRTKVWTRLSLGSLKPRSEVYKEITGQGLPASLNMMSIAMGIFIITYFVSLFGNEAVAAFGIATRVEQIAILPSIGLNIAIVSFTGQNNGARRFDRIRLARRVSLKYGLYVSLVGGIIVYAFAPYFMWFFAENQEVVDIGVDFLRIISLSVFAYAIFSQTSSMLKGLKKPFRALWITLTRQIFLPIVILSTLVFVFDIGLTGIWWALFANYWFIAAVCLGLGEKYIRDAEASAGKR